MSSIKKRTMEDAAFRVGFFFVRLSSSVFLSLSLSFLFRFVFVPHSSAAAFVVRFSLADSLVLFFN